MQETNQSRKVDSTGRVIIPSGLRDELSIQAGDVCEFFIHEHEGDTYLCIKCPNVLNKIEEAKRILREAGIKI